MTRSKRSRSGAPGRTVPAAVAGTCLLAGVFGVAGLLGPAAGLTDTAYAQEQPVEGKLLLVLDSSLSMEETIGGGQTKIQAARDALHTAVDALPADAPVGMRVFGATKNSSHDPKKAACTDSQLVVPISTGNQPALKQAIDAYQPFGDTPIAHALEQAAQDVGKEGKRSILLVSDGEETCVPDPCKIARQITQDGIDLQINTIGFRVNDTARRQLQCIAEHGNGTYYDADNAESLARRLTRLSERAFRPFQFTGTPLQLSTSWDDALAAQPVGPGQYLTKSAQGGIDRYVVIEKEPGSSLWVTATTRGPARPSSSPSLTIELASLPEARPCGHETARGANFNGAQPVFSSDLLIDPVGGTWPPFAETCAESDRLMLRIRNGWKEVEKTVSGIPYTLPIELLIAEEGAVADPESLPPPDENVQESDLQQGPLDEISEEEPQEVTGGLAFSDAPLLAPGNLYRDQIVPGESLVYRVNADFGQQLQWEVEFQELPQGSRFPWPGSDVEVSMLNPARSDFLRTEEDIVGDEVVSWRRATYDVRYRNREKLDPRITSIAGDYYIVVQADHHDMTVPITFDLAVAAVGEPSGHPGYAPTSASADGRPFAADGTLNTTEKGDEATPDTGDREPSDDQDTTESADTDQPGTDQTSAETTTSEGLAKVALPAGLGAVAVLAVAFAVLLLRRPRRPQHPQHPPHQPQPPHDQPPFGR